MTLMLALVYSELAFSFSMRHVEGVAKLLRL